jgi:hypothetical protein
VVELDSSPEFSEFLDYEIKLSAVHWQLARFAALASAMKMDEYFGAMFPDL